jgi:hypothetical protein
LSPVATDICSSVTLNVIRRGTLINNTITNTWTATDVCGNVSEVFTQLITISAVTIEVSTSDALTGLIPVQLGNAVILKATVNPAESGISVTFKLDNGNGTLTSYGPVETASGIATYTVSGLLAEVYQVTATAGSDCATATTFFPVFDPNGGFVTGGGWFLSPKGALVGDDNYNMEGKANFGFVSKYKKGSSTPEGNTEFQFHAGSLNFSSSSYNYGSLVIAGAQAIYKGVGTVNGVSGYSFMVSAVDGQVKDGGGTDKFRIKIWNTKTGDIVYDNQVGAADNATASTGIGGGSIMIQPAAKTKSASINDLAPVVTIEPILKAYPNPFTERLNIEFSSATDAQAKLEIYSITGAKLETLFNGPVFGGVLYNFEYLPRLASSQMVLYHLTIDGKTRVGKVIYNERR